MSHPLVPFQPRRFGGGVPKGLGSHRGVRMGPGVSPVGGCMFGHRVRPVLAGGLVCEIL